MEIVYEESGGTQRRVSWATRPPWRVRLRGLATEIAWPDLCRDLIELATSVWIADRLVRRPRLGPRQIKLALPVRSPDKWQSVEPLLGTVLSFLTQDSFEFIFQPFSGGGSEVTYPSRSLSEPAIPYVALFSGGLDSACAAARFAAAGQQTVFITQYTNGLEQRRGLLADIQSYYAASAGIWHAGFYTAPAPLVSDKLRERSQRSRPFLFLSLALATAAALGAREVLVCENGPLSLNLPLNLAMVPTRHAHSTFLVGMERLAQGLFSAPVRVRNPFELETKGEMAMAFRPYPELALETVSCWNQQWASRRSSFGTRHCGWCLPCLVRRASLVRAGILIPPHHFQVDVRSIAAHCSPLADDDSLLGPYRALMKFVREVASCVSWRAFVRRFPEVIEAEPTFHQEISDRWFKDLFAMMKRFAAEVDTALTVSKP